MTTQTKQYESIIVQAHFFTEGGFYTIGALGYITDDGPDDPIEIETDPHCLEGDKYNVDDVIDQLRMLAALYSKDAERVTILYDGNEVKAKGYLCSVTEHLGEYEFRSEFLTRSHVIDDDLERLVATFRDGGEVMTGKTSHREVDDSDYDVLAKYMTEL